MDTTFAIMKAGLAIRARKRIIGAGEWKLVTGRAGRMPRSAFPIAGGDPTVLGRNWHWRIDELASATDTFRLLTAFDHRTEEFLAWLAATNAKNAILLARYEFHGSHPGYHCHAPCDEIGIGDLGALRTRNCNRYPGGNSKHRRLVCATNEAEALAKSFEFYRVVSAPEGAFI